MSGSQKFKENLKSILIAVGIALIIRVFIIEAFKIPSGSMIPTLTIGDHIFVNKFVYGLRLPFTEGHFLQWRDPKRGEVAVFVYPQDRSKDYIKRTIGLPDDEIEIVNTDLYINGQLVEKKKLDVVQNENNDSLLNVSGSAYFKTIPSFPNWEDYDFFEEKIGDNTHIVQYYKNIYRANYKIEVPPGSYFMMGDNRDNSADSREWGFVPQGLIKGGALFVWLPWDSINKKIRWHEFGRVIK